jgi:phospholipase/carboxylesterase
MLEYEEVATSGGQAELCVIFLHGLGADGHDFEPIVPELGLEFPARFVFPHAPVRRVTINDGMPMRAWYDILGWGSHVRQDAEGIRASAFAIEQLVERELERGMTAERVVLAGFSQGGAIALHTGLRARRALGGLIALSTYLPVAATLAAECSKANAGIPIFMAHGTTDPVVPLAFGESSRATLVSLGYSVDWHTYRMAHTVCIEEISAIGAWLAQLRQVTPP